MSQVNATLDGADPLLEEKYADLWAAAGEIAVVVLNRDFRVDFRTIAEAMNLQHMRVYRKYERGLERLGIEKPDGQAGDRPRHRVEPIIAFFAKFNEMVEEDKWGLAFGDHSNDLVGILEERAKIYAQGWAPELGEDGIWSTGPGYSHRIWEGIPRPLRENEKRMKRNFMKRGYYQRDLRSEHVPIPRTDGQTNSEVRDQFTSGDPEESME